MHTPPPSTPAPPTHRPRAAQGLSSGQKRLCDSFVYIPQYGDGTASLNVAVAASITLHHFALWAQYEERARDGEKYVVAERPQRTSARGVAPAFYGQHCAAPPMSRRASLNSGHVFLCDAHGAVEVACLGAQGAPARQSAVNTATQLPDSAGNTRPANRHTSTQACLMMGSWPLQPLAGSGEWSRDLTPVHCAQASCR